MKKSLLFAMPFLAFAAAAQAAPPVQEDVRNEIIVDVSDQVMKVYRDGALETQWAVSTARPGKKTPRGSWSPDFLSKNHKSSRYNNAPMPYAIFFSGNYAVHGTNDLSHLGSPASAGCIRLDPENAKILFDRVKEDGMRSFRVSVQD
jgi:lipoprotein-anchoring transpeptidase ErfK/SrfK